MKHTDIKSQEY